MKEVGIEGHTSTFQVEVFQLTFCKDAFLGPREEELGDGIQAEEDDGLKGGEDVVEVHQRGDEDQEV